MTAEQQEYALSNEELVAIMENRAATYGLLARLYRVEVDSDMLETLRTMKFPRATGNDRVDAGYYEIVSYLSNVWENTLTELAADYVRTFIGHSMDGHAAAYPFESVYTSEHRLLMQDSRTEVLAIYRAAGLEKQLTWKEGEDHIALELEFMQITITRTVEALCKGDIDEALRLIGAQRNFLDEHIVSWVPMFTEEMLRHSKTDFYRGLAHATEGFLEEDAKLLDELLA